MIVRGSIVDHFDIIGRHAVARRLLGGVGHRGAAGAHHGVALAEIGRGLPEAVLGDVARIEVGEFRLQVAELDAVLRALRARDGGADRAEIELHELRIVDVRGARHAEQVLRLEIRLERVDLRVGAAGGAQIVDRGVVDREESHRRAVLGRHVGDGRAVGHRQRGRALAAELDELADDLLLAQHFGDRQHEVGRGDAFGQLAGQLDADDIRREEIHRLAEHPRLGLDAAHAPADDADAVDHRRVAVGADQRVRIVDAVLADGRRAPGTRDSPGARCRCRAARP